MAFRGSRPAAHGGDCRDGKQPGAPGWHRGDRRALQPVPSSVGAPVATALRQDPEKFYLELRLNEARRLLRESAQPIAHIAHRCGFVSASHLGDVYRRTWGCTPGEERRKFDETHS
ncbi:helix-turn-helix domain-containing protein [Pseudomonas sp. RTB3]|nr:helix-turn-helix domain-containing protein [Pseudomonas sp. RTB3]